jgi:hypothetical protein
MNPITEVIVGLALILFPAAVIGIIGAKLDLPLPLTAILGGSAAVLAIHFGFPA